MTRVLLIDDEPDLWTERFRALLTPHDVHVEVLSEPARAISHIAADRPDVVLLDSIFKDALNGEANLGPRILRDIARRFPKLPVVIFTSTLSEAGTEETSYPEAYRLFCKRRFADPDCDPDAELAALLTEAATSAALEAADLGFVVGHSPAMQAAAARIQRFARHSGSILIYGEMGTGKELAALAVHRLSGRRGPFVAIDCGALREVLESRLFGHAKGAFTDARDQHLGLFEEANGGTLFLDEIHAMSGELQDKLLRAVETKVIRRVGGKEDIAVDVRIVAATNIEPERFLAEGRFRPDLYQRLSEFDVRLPPLRERPADLPTLVATLVARLNRELGTHYSTRVREDVLDKLRRYSWPGNIRELLKVLRTAMVLGRSNVLTPGTIQLPEEARAAEPSSEAPAVDGAEKLAEMILIGHASWIDVRRLHATFQRAVLVHLFRRLGVILGRKPLSRDIAEVAKTTDNNVRQVISKLGGISGLRDRTPDVSLSTQET